MASGVLGVLARQHQQDLEQCNRILKNIQQQGDKRAVRDEVLRFWNNGLQKHVQSEDMVLIPFLVRHRFYTTHIEILKREHNTIRMIAQRLPLPEDDGIVLFKSFIKLVEQHIEFVDRVIMKKMEDEIPATELKQLELSFGH